MDITAKASKEKDNMPKIGNLSESDSDFLDVTDIFIFIESLILKLSNRMKSMI